MSRNIFFTGLVAWLIFFSTTFAFTPSVSLLEKLDWFVERIETIIDIQWESLRGTFVTQIQWYKTMYQNNEWVTYALDYILGSIVGESIPSLWINYMTDSYEIDDEVYGTKTVVTVDGETRYITTNALPNHDTGQFPSNANPNTISAQDNSYELPIEWVYTDWQWWAREPWVAINWIKFEPETAERVECDTWETYRIEAKQNTFDVIGLDDQNAHVQPTGTYHYHGISEDLVEYADHGHGEDLVHVWFAKDGFSMYYSKSWAYEPSYTLSSELRSWTSCEYRGLDVEIDWSVPDGTYVSDWIFDESLWDLDECNGVIIDGEYSYLLTDDFPYIPRCLQGEVASQWWPWWGQWGPWGGWPRWAGWPPPPR